MESKSLLSNHFEHLRQLVPQVYHGITETEKRDQLVSLLKKSLSIIEAVYLQDPAMFQSARILEYNTIVREMETMGISYQANPELIKRASDAILISAKKPMVKAGNRTKPQESEDRKAV